VTAYLGMGMSGQAGEADAIKSDVEDLQGSMHDDKLYGNGGQNHLSGLPTASWPTARPSTRAEAKPLGRRCR
jgi:hypothetical protein